MRMNEVLEPGSLLLIETGEYSDRQTHGPVRVLKRLDKNAVAAQYVAEFKVDPKEDWIERPAPDKFLPWLVAKGYAEDLKCSTWHAGSYSSFDLL